MTDNAFLNARRRWLESGAPAEHGIFIRERMRAGELSLEKVRLAAYLGIRGASLALASQCPPSPPPVEEVEWIGVLHDQWGTEALVRAAVAIAGCGGRDYSQHQGLQEAFSRASRWVAGERPVEKPPDYKEGHPREPRLARALSYQLDRILFHDFPERYSWTASYLFWGRMLHFLPSARSSVEESLGSWALGE